MSTTEIPDDKPSGPLLGLGLGEGLGAGDGARCWCHACRPVTYADMRMVLCPDCGNKRCPKAQDHRNICSGSNDIAQDEPCRKNPMYHGPSNCNFMTVGCTIPAHRLRRGSA